MSFEFTPWPKTSRLFRDIVVTEKIDGTNAAIHIGEDGSVAAQSRTRLITPESDNFGFARWVHDHADSLVQVLGPGLHFGEWWGRGIQRGYGLDHRRFSLFNTSKWRDLGEEVQGEPRRGIQFADGSRVESVPVLYEGPFSQYHIEYCMDMLRLDGSSAVPGFDKPEGICVFHTASGIVQKATLVGDEKHKNES